ncbi:hypothetical protein DPMN_162956 [Dreissena polymorpha]|uniref:Uncharacterized protein n=1 Tax=Dreissena polymorpha TaxID=45954 RepID=A0A9D4EQB6_DREPO|nr:hypothetical protein DPMN_162956 [Dreissena polymorpha]
MKTILSVCTVFFCFGFEHIEAVTDEEFQALFTRLTALEENQVVSDKRIRSLEKDIVSYEKRVANLETYRKLSDRKVFMLKREHDCSNRRLIALEEKLSDKTFAGNEKGKKPFDNIIEASGKRIILSDIVLQTFEENNASRKDSSGQDEGTVAANDKNTWSPGNLH